MRTNVFSLAIVLLLGVLTVSNVSRAQVPTISTAPTNQALAAGGTLSMSVTANGGTPLAYQWFQDGRWLLGATNSTLTVTNAGLTNSGAYFVVVTNGSGMIISVPALAAVGNSPLVVWGYNSTGQLGDGTTSGSSLPVTIVSNVVIGAAGGNHSLFVTADGTLWAMGENSFGELGDGSYNSTNLPVSVASNVVAVAGGLFHSLFVTGDGTLWAMGRNNAGQLGNANSNNSDQPISLAGNVVAVAAGALHSLFVKADGTLWTMGENINGELGDGVGGVGTNNGTQLFPECVASNVVAVAAGEEHSLFVKTDGTLWAMGGNNYGQLGNRDSSGTNAGFPEQVGSNVTAVAAGSYHSLYVTTDGSLWAMGDNGYGQLGNGTNINSDQPVSVAGNVLAPAGGAYHSLFAKMDGTLWAMGQNSFGQLGNGAASNSYQPVNVPNLFQGTVFPGDQADHSMALGINHNGIVTLGDLNQTYTGGAINVSVSTTPAGLTVNLSYNGSSSAPTNPGSYTVIGTVNDPYYTGSSTNVLTVAPTSPIITMAPTNQDLNLGGTLTMRVTASGSAPAFQWFKDNHFIFGATNSTLTVASVGVTNTGTYYVVVTNLGGMAISIPASVLVGNPSVMAWGWDNNGQLGNGGTNNSILPASVATNVVAGAAGENHSLYITADGTLWAMGNNQYGQLGNGKTNEANLPVSVGSNVVACAAGAFHSLFVTADGTLWAMGDNNYGQLGNGTTNNASLPVSIASNVVAVTAGLSHSLFVTADGTLWAMGYNQFGQLGIGTYISTNRPVSAASNVVAMAAGVYHSLFIKANGTLWAAGYDNYGQLGTPGGEYSLPVNVANNVMAVAAGADHSLFITTNGTLWAMGADNDGQLGNGTSTGSLGNPTPVSVASNVVACAAGQAHSMFAKTDGTLWAMGYNGYGELGNGTTSEANSPGNVPQLYGANVFPGPMANHSLAPAIMLYPPTITAAPTSEVLAAGGAVTLNVTTAVVYPAGPPAYQWFKDGQRLMGATNSMLTIANAGVNNSGTYYVAATNSDGMVISTPALVGVGNPVLSGWGYNAYGQLGDGTTINAQTTPVGLAANVVAGAAGAYHSLFITADGTLWAMGNNQFGQLGTGTNYASSDLPVSVASNVVAVAAGDAHSLFVKSDGTLWAMGSDVSGQLGNGTATGVSAYPTPISVASNVVAVAAGVGDSFFLKADGTLWSMGSDPWGQLGTGPTSNPLPLKVANGVVAVAAGQAHSLFVKGDGTLWAAGYNAYGELGNGTTSNTNLPVSVASNVVAVAAGGYHSLFVRTNGTLWAMGYNNYGQLGTGTTANQATPVSVASNVVAVAAGQDHSLFVMTNGTLWAMGENDNGQLGNGTTTQESTPVKIGNVSAGNVFAADEDNDSLMMGSITASVTLSSLNQTYTGGAINPAVATSPAALTVNLTYNGSSEAPTNVGVYYVVAIVSDPIYSGTSTNTLIIIPAGLTNQIVPLGGTVTLDASGGGTGEAYQWFKDGHLILGATNNPLTWEKASLTDSGTYFVVMTNNNGMVISLPVSVVAGNSSLLTWGDNNNGELGNGTTGGATVPIALSGDVVAGAAGAYHSLFVTMDGTLWAMGLNNYGQLGNGTNSGSHANPVPISTASNVVACAAGASHSLFVTTSGMLWSMGYNYYGQLGNGTNNSNPYSTPLEVAGNVVTAAAGNLHSLYLTTDGTLWAMGYNAYGQLGNGTSITTNLPVRVASNVTMLAAGAYHSLFIKTDGTLWAMGENLYGQLGYSKNNGNASANPTPALVASNVVAVAAGAYHSVFIRTDGTLWTMGWNVYGQLGNGTTNNADLPINVASNVVAVAAGYGQSLFIKTDGTLWAMGYNANGQLGSGTTNNAALPVCVPWLAAASVFPADMAYHSMALGVLPGGDSISLPGGIPTLDFLGMPGGSYNVERSTDLWNWSVIWITNAPANGIIQFTDPNAPLANAYYQLQPSQ